ncbi:MAG TPA: tRNA (N6-threonylcarbamoyladenosine(37)-N6)-methyltransferase TrmO [Chloroflexi bacterium]|nr:MAG: tRNA (N6-threonylcarbamoyladenosine(37)-N6)-methyltransferase TrmO [Anaerolineaceae bacterium 4572_5.1]HEY85664.1 tRNA (N6-threonylcarbamoyladenosine(37)-N6)-methyltransferase TrmO [Chloroflexota bacterium]
MHDNKIIFHPIGVIHSPHKVMSKTPIQPVFCSDIKGTVVLDAEYADGLKDLQEFSHIYLFYYFHQSQKTCLRLKPYLSDQEHGIFATRTPHRPNKLGMSLVRLMKIKDTILHVKDIDILDGTPLFDIKPYIQRFDSRENTRSGWQDAIPDDVASVRGLRNSKR